MSFMPGKGTINPISILRQMLEKDKVAGRKLCMEFVDLEKAFDHVPREVIWWTLRKNGVIEREKYWLLHKCIRISNIRAN